MQEGKIEFRYKLNRNSLNVCCVKEFKVFATEKKNAYLFSPHLPPETNRQGN